VRRPSPGKCRNRPDLRPTTKGPDPFLGKVPESDLEDKPALVWEDRADQVPVDKPAQARAQEH